MKLLLLAKFILITLILIGLEAHFFEINAQSKPDEVSYSYSLWGGYSGNSVRLLGKTANSQTLIYGIGYQHKLREYRPNRVLWFTADIIPYIHFDYPKRDENDRRVSRSGFGFSPIGFLLVNRVSGLFSPYLQSSGGIIYMEDNFPTDKARRLNFTFDVTLGNKIELNSFALLSFGYKFHHISNAETGVQNPGLDSNFLFLTLSIH